MIVLQGRKKPVERLAFVPGTRRLVAAGSDHPAVVWDLETGATADPGVPDEFLEHHFTVPPPGGRRLYAVDHIYGECQTFDPDTGTAADLAASGAGYVLELAVAPDGARLILACDHANRHLRGFAVGPTGRLSRLWQGPVGTDWNHLAFFPDGRRFAVVEMIAGKGTAPSTTDVVIGDAATGAFLARVPAVRVSHNCSLRPSPDGTKLLGMIRTRLVLWDAATGAELAAAKTPAGKTQFTGAAFDPSGRWLLTANNDATVRVWDAATLREARALAWPVGQAKSVAVSPDGMLAAVGGDRGQVVVWDFDG